MFIHVGRTIIYQRSTGQPGRATIITTFGIFIAFTLVTVGLFWWLIHQNLMAAQINHLKQLGEKLTQSVAYQATASLQEKNIDRLAILLDGLTYSDGIVSADIYTDSGELLAHSGLDLPLNTLISTANPGERYFAFIKQIIAEDEPIGFVRAVIDRDQAEGLDDQNRRLSLFLAFMMTVIASAIFFYLGHYTALYQANALPRSKKPESLLRERQHQLRPYITSPAIVHPRLIIGSTEYNIRRILPLITKKIVDSSSISALSPNELNIILRDKRDIKQLIMVGATIHQLCFERHIHNFFVYLTNSSHPTVKLPLTGIFVTDESMRSECQKFGSWKQIAHQQYWQLEQLELAMARLTERRASSIKIR